MGPATQLDCWLAPLAMQGAHGTRCTRGCTAWVPVEQTCSRGCPPCRCKCGSLWRVRKWATASWTVGANRAWPGLAAWHLAACIMLGAGLSTSAPALQPQGARLLCCPGFFFSPLSSCAAHCRTRNEVVWPASCCCWVQTSAPSQKSSGRCCSPPVSLLTQGPVRQALCSAMDYVCVAALVSGSLPALKSAGPGSAWDFCMLQ